MIESLRIESLAVVDSLELEFGPGLNVLTGETGAGKSIVLGALSLLAGGRASAEVVREGADAATVEAVFSTRDLPEFERSLAERGLESEDGTLIVRRVVARSGRSRAWVAGALVPIGTLSELFDGRIEISSQHDSQALLRPESHGRLLDAHGGLQGQRGRLAEAVRALRVRDEEIRSLESEADERARREDFLTFQVGEIDEAAIEAGEFERIAQDRSRLRHAGRLREEAGTAASLLEGDGGGERPGADALLADAARRIERLTELDLGITPLAERLRAAELEVADLASELAHYAEAVQADDGRLGELEERARVLERLQKKYGADEAEIAASREQAQRELDTLGGSDARLEKLAAEREAASAALARAAAKLTRARRKAAAALTGELEGQLHGLAMPGARFEVALEPVRPTDGLPCASGGAEAPEFRFSANEGMPPRALRRVASGGELSRVFLALKNALRRAEAGSALVFDEVDAGIGGGVADRVGAVLGELAGAHQVLCITHLPQIAARGDVHFAVRKRRGAKTRSQVERLAAEGRVAEIARMAGGEKVTEATLEHARALLKAAR